MGAVKEKAEIDRQGSEQIDDAEKTEDVFARFFQAVDTCQVFYGEEESEQVFQNSQNEIGRIGEYVHTFQNNEQYTQYDTADKQNIEQFAFGRIGFEYDRNRFSLSVHRCAGKPANDDRSDEKKFIFSLV